jgi:6-phosphofructokinase 1
VLTGGGDCPGLNAVIRGVVMRLDHENIECVGITEGWRGLLERETLPLERQTVREILHVGGTILGSSRINPRKRENGMQRAIENVEALELDALVAIGGDDTLGVASDLHAQFALKVVGVPKTIDNDLYGTDYTFGFDTAVNVATEAIDRLRTTTESHRRVMVVECMGRTAGWIAAYAGVASGSDIILVPERDFDIEHVIGAIRRNRARGKRYNVVVAAEGAWIKGVPRGNKSALIEILDDPTRRQKIHEYVSYAELEGADEFGHPKLGGFIGKVLNEIITEKAGLETREMVLGHIQRGGRPTAFDRILGTRYGVKAAEMILEDRFGEMAALQGKEMVTILLSEATGQTKFLDLAFLEMAEVFFG